MDESKISVMVVEDEPLARQGLILQLEKFSWLEVTSACATASDAKVSLKHNLPDVIFLDIEMPGMSGVDFAQELFAQNPTPPQIIFVTAFKEFALDAFGVHAFDYLLKPFCEERFERCLTRLREHFIQCDQLDEHKRLSVLVSKKTGNTMDKFMSDLTHARPGNLHEARRTISVKSGTEWLRVELNSINWIEAAGDYMCVHTTEDTHIIRKTLKQFEKDLPEQSFVRISRSVIVNRNKIAKLTPNANGEYFAHLISGEKVKVTRGYKLSLEELE